jgi:dTDP-4-dehydrorhamnose reductase
VKALVTGAAGMLGRALCAALHAAGDEVLPLDLADADITDMAALRAAAGTGRFDVVFHLAAFTRVDDCEIEQERAYLVNALGSRNAALLAAERRAAVLALSTDYVFDGRAREPYREYDRPGPLSVYGATKLAGERALRQLHPRHYVVRSSWLFGAGGANFVDILLRKAEAGETLRVVDDQRGSPTYTEDLAPALIRIARSGLYGTYHVTNRGECTWYDFAAVILKLAAPGARLERVTSAALARPAPRPAYSVLSNLLYERCVGPALPDWSDALARYLRTTRDGRR